MLSILKNIIYKSSSLLPMATVLLAAPMIIYGCGKKDDTAEKCVRELTESDSVPVEIKKFVKAVNEDNIDDFAQMVNYPIKRPYPLKEIKDAKEMRHRYRDIVDDSLKKAITHSRPSDWNNDGWRGWTLHNGEYVWIDSTLYDITYLSAKERSMLDSLSKAEIASLHPSLRDGWIPVRCLKGRKSRKIYRIDHSRRVSGTQTNTSSDSLRLAVYPEDKLKEHSDMLPSEIMTGYESMEGSASTLTYYFTGPAGVSVYYVADISDDSQPEIVYTYPDGKEEHIPVDQAYWLDIIQNNDNKGNRNDSTLTPDSATTVADSVKK